MSSKRGSPLWLYPLSCYAGLRKNYDPSDQVPLDIDTLPTTDPFELFSKWFSEARESGKVFEPNAMTLATADR